MQEASVLIQCKVWIMSHRTSLQHPSSFYNYIRHSIFIRIWNSEYFPRSPSSELKSPRKKQIQKICLTYIGQYTPTIIPVHLVYVQFTLLPHSGIYRILKRDINNHGIHSVTPSLFVSVFYQRDLVLSRKMMQKWASK